MDKTATFFNPHKGEDNSFNIENLYYQSNQPVNCFTNNTQNL